jgi:hypothetical protein
MAEENFNPNVIGNLPEMDVFLANLRQDMPISTSHALPLKEKAFSVTNFGTERHL